MSRIRQAVPEDSAALTRLARDTYAAAFGHTFTPADLAAHLQRHLSADSVNRWITCDSVLLAEADGRLVGFVQFGPAGLAMELRRLYVLDEFQGRGIGSCLLQAALAHPDMAGADCIVLDVWERNHGARRLYERYGFQVVGRRSFEVASGASSDDDLIMQRLACQNSGPAQ